MCNVNVNAGKVLDALNGLHVIDKCNALTKALELLFIVCYPWDEEDAPAEETGSRQAHPPTAPSRSLPSIGGAPTAA